MNHIAPKAVRLSKKGFPRDHILIAADLVAAATAGDNAKVEDARERWYANADDIAAFLNAANTQAWPLADMKAEMKTHLDNTLEEALVRLKGDYPADIAAYDKVRDQILGMADMLGTGIIRQFPDMIAVAVLEPKA